MANGNHESRVTETAPSPPFTIRHSPFTIRQATRLAAAVLIGLTFGAYEDMFRSRLGSQPSDFAQPYVAGQLLREGRNPYQEIGPTGPVHHQFHLIYPATAATVAMPFGLVSMRLANGLFVGIGAALLFWALTRHGFRNPQLLVFTAFPMTVFWSSYTSNLILSSGSKKTEISKRGGS